MNLEDLFAKIPQALADHAQDTNHKSVGGPLSEQELCGVLGREGLLPDQVLFVVGGVEVGGESKFHMYGIEVKGDGQLLVVDPVAGQFSTDLLPGQRITSLVNAAPDIFVQPEPKDPGIQILYGSREDIAARLGLKYQPDYVFSDEYIQQEVARKQRNKNRKLLS